MSLSVIGKRANSTVAVSLLITNSSTFGATVTEAIAEIATPTNTSSALPSDGLTRSSLSS